jgi:hypothetical protein
LAVGWAGFGEPPRGGGPVGRGARMRSDSEDDAWGWVGAGVGWAVGCLDGSGVRTVGCRCRGRDFCSLPSRVTNRYTKIAAAAATKMIPNSILDWVNWDWTVCRNVVTG